jgi:excisionase family DNA binding protein
MVDGLTSLLEGGKKPPEDTLFTRQESAARARLSLSTLDRLIKSGDLEVVRIRHSIRIRKSALDALLQGSENAESGTPGIDSRKNTT